ncbi:MAG: FapA family protein [Treponema sp.]|jgi:uncharacterized protein (DUF342 family)|nr:FapA family protein [Treponema sp.]
MAVIAKGNASIVIDPEETLAALVFTPDPEGLGWDADAVIKLAGENRLSPPPSPKTLEPFLQKAARAKTKDPMQLTLYEGVPPEEPAGETVAWEALVVPPDLAAFEKETLAAAGAPELYRIRVEKTKKETVVKKPAPLPFLPPKEEKVITWDRREIREAAEVDAEVQEIKYAEKGAKAGTVSPPKPGKPGRNVFNRPIPPKTQGDGAFLLGGGLAREKNFIVAQRSGFLRIGKNWADIVPLAKPLWSAGRGSDGLTFYFKFEAGDPRFPPPKGKEVLDAAKAAGAGEASLVSAESVDKAIAEALASGEDIPAFSLLKVQEAQAAVDIDADKTEAVLCLRKGVAGALPLEMRAVSQAIRDSGVRGFDAEKLKAGVRAFMEGPDLELRYTLVQGKAPARGKDRKIEIRAALLEEGAAKAVLERLRTAYRGNIPIAEVTGLAPVRKKETAAELTGDAEGEAGTDVFGAEIPGLPGNDPELRLLRGLGQHGRKITAEEDGLLLIKSGPGFFLGEVIPYRDGKIKTEVSEDAMEAGAELLREEGAGLPLNPAAVLEAFAAAGVTKGVDEEAVRAACRAAGEKGSWSGILARGEMPAAKGSPVVRWLLPGLGPGGPKPGSPPVSVAAGTPVAEISPGDPEGKPGFDVRGKELPVTDAVPVGISHDDSIQEIPEGKGVRLSAARAGELSCNGQELRVSGVRSIKGNAGKATGNINFPGDIKINGKVEPGFSVVGRNVFVAGLSEAALVSAGGRAVMAGGIKGAGKGVVRARSTIEAAFAEAAVLLAVGDIKIKLGCAGCNVKTNGMLLVSGETGKLAGGVCRARLGVNVQELGSVKGLRTEISFGQDYLLKDQIEVAEAEIEKIRAALKRADAKIKNAIHNPAALGEAGSQKVGLLKKLEQLNLRIFTLREKFEEHHESEVKVRGAVHPGVVMESHGRYYEINRLREAAVFYFDRETGRIKERSRAPV